MDKNDEVAKNVCTEIFKQNLRNQWYKLKRDYFLNVPRDQVLQNKPPKMTMENWVKLVTKWDNDKFKRLCEKNKKNREGVKQTQKTGSRSYVAHFTSLKEKYNNQGPTPIQFYKETHTSRKDGSMTEEAEQVYNLMESRSESEGTQSKTEVEIVSEVMKEKSSSSTFLANIGFLASERRPSTASARHIQELEERLQAQEREAREAHDKQHEQLTARLETQQKVIDDLRTKQQEELEAIRKSHQDELESVKLSHEHKISACEKKQQEMDAVLGFLLRQQAQTSSSAQTTSTALQT